MSLHDSIVQRVHCPRCQNTTIVEEVTDRERKTTSVVTGSSVRKCGCGTPKPARTKTHGVKVSKRATGSDNVQGGEDAPPTLMTIASNRGSNRSDFCSSVLKSAEPTNKAKQDNAKKPSITCNGHSSGSGQGNCHDRGCILSAAPLGTTKQGKARQVPSTRRCNAGKAEGYKTPQHQAWGMHAAPYHSK